MAIDTVVAQGCRPVGDLLQVTRAKQNILYELDGRPAFEVLEGLVAGLDGKDRKLATTSLFIGVVMDEFEEEPGAGDFLIRNLIGIDPPQRGDSRWREAYGRHARPLPPPRRGRLRRRPARGPDRLRTVGSG